MTEQKNNVKILVIDDEENMRHMLSTMLSQFGYTVDMAENGLAGIDKIKTRSYDFILCDIKMPEMDGLSFLSNAASFLKEMTVIMMSAYGSIDTAVSAMKLGAYDFISKPFKKDEVFLALKKAEERERLRRENTRLRSKLQSIEDDYHFGKLIGKSPAMKSVFQLIGKIVNYATTVLITGESGTGKELIAKAIHQNSSRKDKPFVAVNCGGIPENLLESEFFGYKKGAFTGADRNRKGLFEEANGGTLFLDEVGEMPLALQVKFLRVLQENEVRPIGDARAYDIDVRILAATAKNLEKEVQNGIFRQDLFYRLNVMPIHLPSLKHRQEDIPLLANHFLKKFSLKFHKGVRSLSPETLSVFANHDWPGNVRELENIMERAIILCDSDTLTPDCLSIGKAKTECGAANYSFDLFDGFSLKNAQKIMEKEMIIKALKATGGNRTKATQLLEISHPSLLSKIKMYEIDL